MRNAMVLDCSTAHITKEDNDRLLQLGEDLPVVMANEHGYIVTTEQSEVADEPDAGFSDAFMALLTRAREAGFEYIWLDSAGAHIEGLPTFEW